MDEEMNIYDVYAALAGQAGEVALDEEADAKERKEAKDFIKDYVEHDMRDQRESFSASLKVREMDLKDEDLKMQKRKLIFDYVKLGVKLATFVGGLGYMLYLKHLDYDLQEEGYMPSGLGKWAEREADQIVGKEITRD